MPKVSQHKRRVIPEMSTTTHAHPGLTTAQETVQVVLLIIFSVVGTWIALFRVPWQLSADPCLVAAAATGVITNSLWLTRWLGSRGVIFEQYLLAAFLVYMALVYVMRYLFVSTARAENPWLWVEILSVLIFATLAVLGVKRSPWFLVIGIAAHRTEIHQLIALQIRGVRAISAADRAV